MLLLDGDADYICNYVGFESMVNWDSFGCGIYAERLFQVDALQTNFTTQYRQQQWTNWTVAGTVTGLYKNAGTLSYIRVSQAGHEVSRFYFSENFYLTVNFAFQVPAYGNGKLAIGQAALLYFTQAMQGKPVSST